MSTPAPPPPASPAPPPPAAPAAARALAGRGAPRGARARRRRIVGWLLGAAVVLAVGLVTAPLFHHAVREITLPLRHEDIIRQQARDKGLDPALDRRRSSTPSRASATARSSHAGAQGLMQLTPATARYIATQVGRHRVQDRRPRHAAGQHRLRRLLPALPAWTATAATRPSRSPPTTAARATSTAGSPRPAAATAASASQDIPFPETRAYVQQVESIQHDYRTSYRAELGL